MLKTHGLFVSLNFRFESNKEEEDSNSQIPNPDAGVGRPDADRIPPDRDRGPAPLAVPRLHQVRTYTMCPHPVSNVEFFFFFFIAVEPRVESDAKVYEP